MSWILKMIHVDFDSPFFCPQMKWEKEKGRYNVSVAESQRFLPKMRRTLRMTFMPSMTPSYTAMP